MELRRTPVICILQVPPWVLVLQFFFLKILNSPAYIIQDCWSNKKRDSSGNLQPNSTRFPSGMKALADYVRILMLVFQVNKFSSCKLIIFTQNTQITKR